MLFPTCYFDIVWLRNVAMGSVKYIIFKISFMYCFIQSINMQSFKEKQLFEVSELEYLS